MASVVIDTDVLSFLFKQDTRGDLYKPHIDGKLGVISFMTVAELDFWADSRNWGARRRAQLARFIQPFTVIDSDRELCRKWADTRDKASRAGYHIDTADCWVTATALLHGVPLVTHNREDFVHVSGLTVLSEA